MKKSGGASAKDPRKARQFKIFSTRKLEIVTPEGILLSEDGDLVTLQGSEGQVTILPQHVRLMTQLAPGELAASKAGRETFLAVGEGRPIVSGDRLSALTDMAVAAENIDAGIAEGARQRAAACLRESSLLKRSLLSTPL